MLAVGRCGGRLLFHAGQRAQVHRGEGCEEGVSILMLMIRYS